MGNGRRTTQENTRGRNNRGEQQLLQQWLYQNKRTNQENNKQPTSTVVVPTHVHLCQEQQLSTPPLYTFPAPACRSTIGDMRSTLQRNQGAVEYERGGCFVCAQGGLCVCGWEGYQVCVYVLYVLHTHTHTYTHTHTFTHPHMYTPLPPYPPNQTYLSGAPSAPSPTSSPPIQVPHSSPVVDHHVQC